MSSRQSFEETARYWAEIYAGAPKTNKSTATDSQASSVGGDSAAPKGDEIAIAGLQPQHVAQFVMLGFPQAKVVRGVFFFDAQKMRSFAC